MGDLAKPCADAVDRNVVLIGNDNLQNKLLAGLIDEHADCVCVVRPIDALDHQPWAASALALLDVGGAVGPVVGAHLQSIFASASCKKIAVVNADDELPFDQIVSWPGVRGVFYRDSSRQDLIKGVRALLDGEYWLPRKVLWAHLERTRAVPRSVAPEAAALTKKEMATLKLLITGSSTDNIARRLSVSPHTVKTHIYNVFRKIRVNNRVQAVHWALNNIDGLERVLR